VLGRRSSDAGPLGPAYARGEEKEKKERPLAWDACGPKEMLGQRERKEREREEKRISFFKFLFKFIFQTFKLQSNKNPCIRIMMHKHLLFLKYFSDV
jgi:hypothetical protein